MSYFFTKIVTTGFIDTVAKVTGELGKEGFGVLTEIDVQATLKKKLDVDLCKYKILGACHPDFAYKALSAEPHIGVMMPCNVIVQELENDKIEVSIVNPVASMMAVENKQLAILAIEVQQKLKNVLANL